MPAERVVFDDNVCELHIAGDGRGKSSGPGERLLHLRGLNDVSGVDGSSRDVATIPPLRTFSDTYVLGIPIYFVNCTLGILVTEMCYAALRAATS